MSSTTDVVAQGNLNPVATAELDTFEPNGNAFPTSRCLSGSADHGYHEEWYEPGSIEVNGERVPVHAVYLFAHSEVRRMGDDGFEDIEAEDYPWDWAHIARVQLID